MGLQLKSSEVQNIRTQMIDNLLTSQKLYELSKMDGALMVSENLRKISYANIQLQPKATIHTDESGTRHRTADRVAKQTGNLVLAVSERRNKIVKGLEKAYEKMLE